VRYAAAQQAIRRMQGVSQAISGGPYLRKAPCQFGWDWGPQLPPIGVWKDIRLEGYEGARLAEVHISQQHAGGQVTVEAKVSVQSWEEAPRLVVLRLAAPDGQVLKPALNYPPATRSRYKWRFPTRSFGGRMVIPNTSIMQGSVIVTSFSDHNDAGIVGSFRMPKETEFTRLI
jgi:hypothetical protein